MGLHRAVGFLVEPQLAGKFERVGQAQGKCHAGQTKRGHLEENVHMPVLA
jgi:hypothetical protein